MTKRGYYFGAGPATLPETLLNEAGPELLNWHDTGLSILELGHRTPEFMALLEDAKRLLKKLLAIPDNYHILFLGGAARTQFAMAPMNLLTQAKSKSAYLVTGLWSKLAYEEGVKLGGAYAYEQGLTDDTAFVYYTPNETVDGIYTKPPKTGDVPLVADMTSCILSEAIDVSQFGLVFAGAQKNIGPAGLTLVIVREDLLQHTPLGVLPTMLDYRTHAKHDSLYATPPVFQCEMAHKMFKWLDAQGGVARMEAINRQKASRLYDYIDASSYYVCQVEKSVRSMMNVCFTLQDESKLEDFLDQAKKSGLTGLKGHRVKGGLRASLYNAMPMAGVDALIAFMDSFARD